MNGLEGCMYMNANKGNFGHVMDLKLFFLLILLLAYDELNIERRGYQHESE